MKQVKLKIKIEKPAREVFEFYLNPKNTPKWIDSIIEEKTNEWPVKKGSVYRNTGDGKIWNEYIVSKFAENEVFELTAKDGNYHVRYTLTPIDENSCELEYFEWMKEGELDSPFTIEPLQKLKSLIETN